MLSGTRILLLLGQEIFLSMTDVFVLCSLYSLRPVHLALMMLNFFLRSFLGNTAQILLSFTKHKCFGWWLLLLQLSGCRKEAGFSPSSLLQIKNINYTRQSTRFPPMGEHNNNASKCKTLFSTQFS